MIAPRLQWRPSRRWSWRPLLVAAACAAAAAGLAAWQHRVDRQLEARQALLDRLAASRQAPPRAAAPVPLSLGAAREERQQRLLLARDWGELSSRLAPLAAEDIRLLEVDANPATGALRLTGVASTALQANAYAQRLAGAGGTLRRVRLLGLERQADGIRFEVGAQWNE